MATIDWAKIAEEDRRRKSGVAALPLAAGAGGRARRGGARRGGAVAPVHTMGGYPLAPLESRALGLPETGTALALPMPPAPQPAQTMGGMPPVHSMGGYPLAPLESRALGLPATGPAVDLPLPAAPVSRPPSSTSPAPRLFVDSDGRARAGFNMGEEGRRLGLVDADAAGVPVGVQMVPVQGLSQGSAEVGRDLRYGPPAPVVLAPPPAPPTTESYARTVNAIGGFKAPPMNAREAARMADMDATRAARWNQSGPTSAVNRAVNQIRSQGAALDALTRQTNEQIRLAQGTPQVEGAAGAGVMGWNPRTQRYDMALPPAEQVKQMPIEERLKNVAAAIRSVSGGDVDPLTVMQINNIADPEQKRMAWERVTKGNPELAKQLADYASALLGGPAGTGDGGREPRGGEQGTGAGAQNAQAGAPAAGSAWDKYRRGNR